MHKNASVRGACASDWLQGAELRGRSLGGKRKTSRGTGSVTLVVGSARQEVGLNLLWELGSRGSSLLLKDEFLGGGVSGHRSRGALYGSLVWGGVSARHRVKIQSRTAAVTVECVDASSSGGNRVRKRRLKKVVPSSPVSAATLIKAKTVKTPPAQKPGKGKEPYFKKPEAKDDVGTSLVSETSAIAGPHRASKSVEAQRDAPKTRTSKAKQQASPRKGLRSGGYFKQVDATNDEVPVKKSKAVNSPQSSPPEKTSSRGFRKTTRRRVSTKASTKGSTVSGSTTRGFAPKPSSAAKAVKRKTLAADEPSAVEPKAISGVKKKKSWNEVVEVVQEASVQAKPKTKKLTKRELAEQHAREDFEESAVGKATENGVAEAEADAKEEADDEKVGVTGEEEDEEFDLEAVQKETLKNKKWTTTLDFKLMGREHESIPDETWEELVDELGLLQRWRPMVSFLVANLKFTSKELNKILGRREEIFSTSVDRAHSRCNFLRDIGLSDVDVKKLLLAHPRVLEYRVERTMQNRINFLMEIGVAEADIPKVVVRAPVIFACHVERTLRPRINYLIEEVGVPKEMIGQVIARHPLVVSHSVEEMMAPRVRFLREIGVSKEGVAHMVAKHPQILQYKVESMLPRLQYLQSIGMSEDDIILCVSRLSQVFSLSVETNMKPKFDYLRKELGGDVDTVTRYPAYFSLSLENRIKPRHQILVKLNKYKKRRGAFPMKYLTLSDKDFASKVANIPLPDYEEFRSVVTGGATVAKGRARTSLKP